MKKLLSLGLIAAVMALAACSTSQQQGGRMVHNKEEAAPYADERTVGRNDSPRVERTFEQVQRK